ncbi:MAG: hypothetical protein ACOC04_01755 [Halothece sp.]
MMKNQINYSTSSPLSQALEKILNWFREHKPSYLSSLQKGLTEEEIKNRIKFLPFELPWEVHELYQWRNGITEEGSEGATVVIFPLPLEKAVEIYQKAMATRELSLQSGRENPIWESPYWFPMWEEDGEYMIVVGSKERKNCSQVLNVSETGGLVYYDSVTSMMQTIAECLETSAYYLDEYDDIEVNETKAEPIWRKYNLTPDW